MGNFRDANRANAALDISIAGAIARGHASRAMSRLRAAVATSRRRQLVRLCEALEILLIADVVNRNLKISRKWRIISR